MVNQHPREDNGRTKEKKTQLLLNSGYPASGTCPENIIMISAAGAGMYNDKYKENRAGERDEMIKKKENEEEEEKGEWEKRDKEGIRKKNIGELDWKGDVKRNGRQERETNM
uniref:Uncharacterized protein n=1 Tax=Cacopsylla melanoneura TaxID=428564 RepID=A0A8D8R4G2_9HEMI